MTHRFKILKDEVMLLIKENLLTNNGNIIGQFWMQFLLFAIVSVHICYQGLA